MADPVKRWTVLYTKHLKQKRKVYHDGYLQLLSNNKVVLYDDCENTLSGRFLKQDENVVAGETLAFESFLVDIGEPENARLVKEENLNTSSTCSAKKSVPGRQKISVVSLSPTQRFIKEFKKRERLKCVLVPQPSPSSSTNSTAGEWEALYTTHLTQKSKKYHDGFLRLVNCGTQGRQVKLYDASKEQLSSRFTKKDEVIRSGEMLKFDGYLVDIGDPKGNQDSVGNSNLPLQNLQNNANVSNERHRYQHGTDDRTSTIPEKKLRKSHPTGAKEVSHGKPKNTACSRKDTEPHSYSVCSAKTELRSNIRPRSNSVCSAKTVSRSSYSSHIPLRGANEILNILKKPHEPMTMYVKEEWPAHQFKENAQQAQDVKQTHTLEEKHKNEFMQESSLASDDSESEVSIGDKHSCLGIDSSADSSVVTLSGRLDDISSTEKANCSIMTESKSQPMVTGAGARSCPALHHIVHEPESEVVSSRDIVNSNETCSPVKTESEEDTRMSTIAMEIKSSMELNYPSFDLGI